MNDLPSDYLISEKKTIGYDVIGKSEDFFGKRTKILKDRNTGEIRTLISINHGNRQVSSQTRSSIMQIFVNFIKEKFGKKEFFPQDDKTSLDTNNFNPSYVNQHISSQQESET